MTQVQKASEATQTDKTGIRPFSVNFSEEQLTDLRDRVKATSTSVVLPTPRLFPIDDLQKFEPASGS